MLRAAAMRMLQGAGRASPSACSFPLLCPVHGNLKSSFVNGNCHAQLTLFSDGCLGSIIGEGDAEVRCGFAATAYCLSTFGALLLVLVAAWVLLSAAFTRAKLSQHEVMLADPPIVSI